MRRGDQLVLDLGSELAAVCYVDEIVDGQGRLLDPAGCLTRGAKCVTLDKPRSVSGLIRFDYPEESDGCEVEPAGETPSSVPLLLSLGEGDPDG